mmetsp:Transcript_628/g.1921  ORF Transcript_628/g.1921 Transcript_628/m.1921 type:complete len:291 (+) Transcript_628:1002-1874(+)
MAQAQMLLQKSATAEQLAALCAAVPLLTFDDGRGLEEALLLGGDALRSGELLVVLTLLAHETLCHRGQLGLQVLLVGGQVAGAVLATVAQVVTGKVRVPAKMDQAAAAIHLVGGAPRATAKVAAVVHVTQVGYQHVQLSERRHSALAHLRERREQRLMIQAHRLVEPGDEFTRTLQLQLGALRRTQDGGAHLGRGRIAVSVVARRPVAAAHQRGLNTVQVGHTERGGHHAFHLLATAQQSPGQPPLAVRAPAQRQMVQRTAGHATKRVLERKTGNVQRNQAVEDGALRVQ